MIKSNPKYFFSYVNNKHSKISRKIGLILNDKREYINETKLIADIFQKQFCSMFSTPDATTKKIPSLKNNLPSTSITPDLNFSTEGIL